ncbi:glycoside hydrolase family 88 protein [candidate division KSB1 bacterium]|nr:glycoside hydrolase family 88 protein [candidate division KSB1 bacterium]
MKNLLIPFILLISVFSLAAQTPSSDLDIIRSIADNVLNNTTRTIIDPADGSTYTSSKNLPRDKQFKLNNPYIEWKYWNGVLNLAMLDLYKLTGDEKYKQQVVDNYQFVFDNLDFFKALYEAGIKETGMDQFFQMQMLDHCGSMGTGLIEVYRIDKKQAYRTYLDKVADYIMHKEHRLDDGTLARTGPYNMTVWLDDLYMGIPFLAHYGKLTNDPQYFDFAAKQVKQYNKYLYDKNTGLYFHCYFSNTNENGVARWGRANGWSMIGQLHLLEMLPIDHPDRDTLLAIYRQQVVGLARYQSESGLWHQILDKPDSYLETSCSAMFTYAVAKAVNEGWLDDTFSTIALAGWDGLKTKIRPDGQVDDICVGTWIKNDLVFYYKRPTQLNDIHGLGVVISAGIEVMRMKEKLE